MNQSRTLFVFAAFCLFLIMTSADILKKVGKSGNTGSPGENNCTECHTGSPVNTAGMMSITSDIPNNQYTPGQIYNIAVTVASEGKTIFGLGIEALKTSNTSAGTFIITNSAETQILNAPNGRPNVTHKLNGGTATNSKTFTFQWTAPVAGTGNVTFYGSGVAGNSSNSNNGDLVYTTNMVLTEQIGNAIDPAFNTDNIRIYPSPASDWINVETSLYNLETLNITDINGKTVATYKAQAMTSLFVKSLPMGLYYIQAVTQSGDIIASQKFVKK